MIDFSICRHCGSLIFFDWKGAHHVNGDPPDCSNPEETPDENDDESNVDPMSEVRST